MEYYFSKKGEEMYKAIEKVYPKHPFDLAYERFKKVTRSSPEKENKFIVNRIIRLQLAPNDEGDETQQEVILYDLCEVRLDGLGNPKRYVRTNLGKYPIPQRTVIRAFDEDNQPVIKNGPISEVQTGYEFPFTKEKADELHKWCVDKRTMTQPNVTQYIVERMGERKISCKSYHDWLTGDFETLYATGRADGILDEEPVVKLNKTRKTKVTRAKRSPNRAAISTIQEAIYNKPKTTNKRK